MGKNRDSLESSLQGMCLKANKFKMGIIGEPMSQFNPITLTPLGAENEDEEGDAEDKGTGNRREWVLHVEVLSKYTYM